MIDRRRLSSAIRTVMAEDQFLVEGAWNRYDSVNIAALFADDANFIHIFGGQLDGRTAIEAAHRVIFDTIYKGSHASFTLRSIRFVSPDVTIAFARAHVQFKEGNEMREIETRRPWSS